MYKKNNNVTTITNQFINTHRVHLLRKYHHLCDLQTKNKLSSDIVLHRSLFNFIEAVCDLWLCFYDVQLTVLVAEGKGRGGWMGWVPVMRSVVLCQS